MIRTLLLATLAVCASSCVSEPHEEQEVAAFECICGTPAADFHGCYCDLCVSGQGNAENPLCTCSPLRIDTGDSEG